MSLIAFHRFLIGTAIVFCFGFAAWELMTGWVGGSRGALVLGAIFAVLGIGLTFYLAHLRRFLGAAAGGPPAADAPRRAR